MRVIFGVLVALLLAFAGVSCSAEPFGYWRSENAREDRSELFSNISVLHDLRLGSDQSLSTIDCLYELHRLFDSNSASGKRIPSRMLRKALFVLPLIKKDNAVELAIRPERDIVLTAARRVVIRNNQKGSRVISPDGAIAIDTHTHTSVSSDSLASPAEMLLAAADRGLAGIAITDHDSLEGALRALDAAVELKRQGKLPAEFFVIPGEEISSSDGHIVGLYLTSTISPGRSAEWTIRAIHEQGGLAVAAHPMLPRSLHELANTLPFDAVETESASEKLHYAITFGEDRSTRSDFYRTVTKPRLGASDTHDPQSMAECYTLVRCAPNAEAVREAIVAGRIEPVAAATDADEMSIARRPFLRILATYRCLTDLSPVVLKLTGSKSVGLSVVPRPVIRFYKEF